jgi:hypothetical protein
MTYSMSSSRNVIRLLGVASVAMMVASCSGDEGTSTAATSAAAAAAASLPTTSTLTPLDEAGIDRKTRRPDPGATALTLVNMSVRRSGDYDQAVLTVSGTATPGWAVQYVDTPVQNGTGKAVQLPGKSWLEVLVLETPGPFTNPATYAGPRVAFDNDTPQINTLRYSNQGAGIIQTFVSINGERPNFRVSASSNPTRVVIDVAD